jgi:hypothetical protein
VRELLCKRVEVPGRAEKTEQSVGVDVVEVIGLAAASHQAHGPAAGASDDALQLLGDLGDGLLPRNRPVGSVGHALLRLEHALIVIHHLPDREPLVAGVATAEGIRAVTPHLGNPVPLHADQQAAVD